jgi:hypothetical protein
MAISTCQFFTNVGVRVRFLGGLCMGCCCGCVFGVSVFILNGGIMNWLFGWNSFVPGGGNAGYGVQNIENQRLDSFEGFGVVHMKDTVVNGLVKIQGMLNLSGSTLQSLKVSGTAHVHGSRVIEGCELQGAIFATGAVFNRIVAQSTRLDFAQTQVEGNILLQRSAKPAGQPEIVSLREGSCVRGRITFESGDGIVEVDAASQAMGGVVGGIIAKQAQSEL